MELIKDTAAPKSTKPQRRRKPAPVQQMETVRVTISRRTLEAAARFSDHFQLTPQAVAEGQFYMELEAFGDDLLQSLDLAGKRSPIVDPVTIELEILSDAMELVRIVAKLLNRPLDWLMTLFVDGGVDLLSRQMIDAEEEGGIAGHPDMQDAAKYIFGHSMSARSGRFPKTGKYDAWTQLGIERPTPRKGEGRK